MALSSYTTDLSKEEFEEQLIDRIYQQEWRYAVTYDKSAPHEYFMYYKNPELMRAIGHYIDKYGIDTKFYSKDVRYGIIGNYRYFHGNTYDNKSLMNRARNVPEHLGMHNYTDEMRAKYMANPAVVGEA